MKPLALYSTNPFLKYAIAEKYYGERHYVWCTTVFDPRTHGKYGSHASTPPSSNPCEVYRRLREDIEQGDRDSAYVHKAKQGIINGATAKLEEGVIDKEEHEAILAMVASADLSDFRPLVYVIPYDRVVDQLVEPPSDQRAHHLSTEYVIKSLARSDFDVIEWS